VGIYVAAGDNGYNDSIVPAGTTSGPDYPGTSQYTIAVGATRLVKDTTTARGWSETALTLTNGAPDPTRGAGGSACSLSIVKPTYQTASPCAFKATADVSAVGDPVTGVSVYNTTVAGRNWISVGGTSASAPFIAAIMAATGNGKQTSGEFFAQNATRLWDVTSGTNGTCTGKTLLCNAAVGWDGPTGFGTPNVSALLATATGTGGTGGTGTGTGGTGTTGTGGTDSTGTGTTGTGTTGTGGSTGSQDLQGGCAAGGPGAGLLLGLALLGLRRRRR
jgi:subtilase family serine protease